MYSCVFTHIPISCKEFVIFILKFQASNKTWILDTKSRSWIQGPELSTIRYRHGCFSVKINGNVSEIYVLGGHPSPMSSTEVLNVKESTWSPGPDLPIAMHANVGVESFDNDYLGFNIGGYDQRNSDDLRTIYGLRNSGGTERWVSLKSMQLPRRYFSAVNVQSPLVPFC